MLTDFNGEAITYDANGCPLTYRDIDCTFTRGTMLATYGSNTFDYDADGIRTKKNGIAFTYVDGKLIRQTGGSGTIDFIYGAGGAIGFKFAGNTYIYRRNLMGDVTHIYTIDGTLVARYVYDAWGNHKITTDVNGIGTLNPIRYRGYYYDTETGLYYLEARYYDPETGRFISQDSIDFIVPNHLTGLNLYAYCSNNPIMYTDPSGCFVITGTVLATAAIIGAVAGMIGGALYGGMTAAANNQNIGAGIIIGALAGAFMGAGSGIASLFIAPVLAGSAVTLGTTGVALTTGAAFTAGTTIAFASGAIGGAGSDIVTQLVNNKMIEDWNSIGISALEWGGLNTMGTYLGSIAGPLENAASFVASRMFGHWTSSVGMFIDILRSKKSKANIS